MSAGSQIYPDTRRRAPRHAHHRARHLRGPAVPLFLIAAAIAGVLAFGAVAGALTGGAPSSRTAAALALGEPTPAVDARVSPAPEADHEGTGALPLAVGACSAAATPLPAPDAEVHPGAVASFAPVRAPIARRLAAFLGDSYTSGYLGTGEGSDGWPAIVSGSQGWRMVNLAAPGIGFVNPGWTAPIRTQVVESVRLKPDLVVVAAGHNDEHYGTDRTARAADVALEELGDGLPAAILVVIGPIWYDGSPVPAIVALRDHLRARAAAIGALFIDPITGRWFAGSNHEFIGADGVHPTNAGHRHIARLLLAALGADPRFGQSPVEVPTATSVPAGAPFGPFRRASLVASCPA